MRTKIDINGNIISWAIIRAGYDLQEFAIKLPKVLQWIEGEEKPTVKQLEGFSRMVHLPFGFLFLPNPPTEELPIPFFRTDKTQTTNVSLNVYETVLLMQQRQSWLRDYLVDNEFRPLSYVGRFRKRENVVEIAAGLRTILGLEENWASRFDTWRDALGHLTDKIEAVGIILVFNGVVENNTRRPIKVDECRGFVLVDEIAPFMFINNSDAKAAQMFTIVHELVHIVTGHSAGFDFRHLQPANDPIELLCDKVAAEFLVPEKSFNEIWQKTPIIKEAARFFKVSEIVIARRALDTGRLTRKEFFDFYDEYRNREFMKQEGQSGGNFYLTTRRRLSMTFAAHVNNAVKSGKLLYRDAYRLTSLKGDTFQTFFSRYFPTR